MSDPSDVVISGKKSCSGFSTVKVRKITASSKRNIAEFSPTPSARVRMATTAKPGLLRNWRTPYRTSWNNVSMTFLLVQSYDRVDPDGWLRGNPARNNCYGCQQKRYRRK